MFDFPPEPAAFNQNGLQLSGFTLGSQVFSNPFLQEGIGGGGGDGIGGTMDQIEDWLKQQQEESTLRKSLVGSGDRSERIRTYNFPQARVTDHRINLTLYKLDEVMAGSLDQVVEPLLNEHQAEQLAALSEQ